MSYTKTATSPLCAVLVALCCFAWAASPTLSGEAEDEVAARSKALVDEGKYQDAHAVWDSVLAEYPNDFYAVTKALRMKARISLKEAKLGEAEKCLRSLRTRWAEPKVGNQPSDLLIETVVAKELSELYREIKKYSEAVREMEHWMKADRALINATPTSDAERALNLLQIGRSNLVPIYKDWGRLDIAQQILEEELRYFNSPEANRDLFSKLNDQYKTGWEFTRAVSMPLQIAELLFQQEKKKEVLALLASVKSKFDDPQFAERHAKQAYAPAQRRFQNERKRFDELLAKAKE